MVPFSCVVALGCHFVVDRGLLFAKLVRPCLLRCRYNVDLLGGFVEVWS